MPSGFRRRPLIDGKSGGTLGAVVGVIARHFPPQTVQVTSAWPVPVATQTLAAPITLNDGDTAHGGMLLEALRGKIFPATGGRLILRLVYVAPFGQLMTDEELPAHDCGIARMPLADHTPDVVAIPGASGAIPLIGVLIDT